MTGKVGVELAGSLEELKSLIVLFSSLLCVSFYSLLVRGGGRVR
ncbi:MAG: hypothetical protein QXX83_06750 [Thermofilum sp.]